MICYRDMSFCADQYQCATPDRKCDRRITASGRNMAIQFRMPVAWMSFRNTCGQFKEKVK